jgi:hypothetical protein
MVTDLLESVCYLSEGTSGWAEVEFERAYSLDGILVTSPPSSIGHAPYAARAESGDTRCDLQVDHTSPCHLHSVHRVNISWQGHASPICIHQIRFSTSTE